MLRKKIALGLGSVAVALMLAACGNGVPDCDDSNAQDEIKKRTLERLLKVEFNIPKDGRDKFQKEAAELLEKRFKFEIGHFMTEKKDEKRKRSVCKAEIRASINEDTLQEVWILNSKSELSKTLPKNQVLTDALYEKEFQKSIEEHFGSTSRYESVLDGLTEKALEDLAKPQKLDYTLRATDDGKLVVQIEDTDSDNGADYGGDY